MLDETLRCSVLAPWAARYSEEETELGGHKIPAGVSHFVSHTSMFVMCVLMLMSGGGGDGGFFLIC